MARGVASTVIVIITVLIAIGGIYYFMFGKSQGTPGNNPTFNPVSPVQQQGSQYGGRRKNRGNKKSATMTTTGIYLLLGAIIVGYITSKFA